MSILRSKHAQTSVILAGKRGSRRQSTTSFGENVEKSGGKKLSNVRSFIILRSGVGVTSFTKGNSANFSSETW